MRLTSPRRAICALASMFVYRRVALLLGVLIYDTLFETVLPNEIAHFFKKIFAVTKIRTAMAVFS